MGRVFGQPEQPTDASQRRRSVRGAGAATCRRVVNDLPRRMGDSRYTLLLRANRVAGPPDILRHGPLGAITHSPPGVAAAPGKYSLPPPLHLCSCPVHVRPARRRRPNQPPRSAPGSAGHRRGRTHPHRAPARPRPHADQLRQATRHHAATAHLRHQPRRCHAALRHHRHRGNPRAHRPRPASRRRARSQTGQPPRPPASRTSHPERPIPPPTARCPTRGPKRQPRRPQSRPPAHARGHRGRGPPPPGGRRHRRYLPRLRDRAEQPTVAGTLPGHHRDTAATSPPCSRTHGSGSASGCSIRPPPGIPRVRRRICHSR